MIQPIRIRELGAKSILVCAELLMNIDIIEEATFCKKRVGSCFAKSKQTFCKGYRKCRMSCNISWQSKCSSSMCTVTNNKFTLSKLST